MNLGTNTRQDIPGYVDVAVVGGGLAGLTAATLAARSGRTVLVLEKASSLGGRAATQTRNGIHFNMGAHALYLGGSARRILEDLAVPYHGGFPPVEKAIVTVGSRMHRMPTTAWSMAVTRLLNWREKIKLVRFLRGLTAIDTRKLDGVSLGDWLADSGIRGRLNDVIQILFRVSTYASNPAVMSAGAAIDQVKIGLAGVLYLDAGWQTLVDGLREAASSYGAEIRASQSVVAVQAVNGGVRVQTADGRWVSASAAVLAVSPSVAVKLLGDQLAALADWVGRTEAVRVACLDVALSQLPRPDRRYAMGLDRPLYYSVHSASAELADPGVAVVHLMKYLPQGEHPTGADIRKELEAYLDTIQPGWRQYIIEQRLLPSMVAANSLPTPEDGGLFGRPNVDVPEIGNVCLAGDWVGHDGMLADAAMASAEAAVSKILMRAPGVQSREQYYVAS